MKQVNNCVSCGKGLLEQGFATFPCPNCDSVIGRCNGCREQSVKYVCSKTDIKALIKPPAKVGRIEVKNIAFGLKGLDVTILVPDDQGGLDPIAEEITKVENVESAEVTDVGRV